MDLFTCIYVSAMAMMILCFAGFKLERNIYKPPGSIEENVLKYLITMAVIFLLLCAVIEFLSVAQAAAAMTLLAVYLSIFARSRT